MTDQGPKQHADRAQEAIRACRAAIWHSTMYEPCAETYLEIQRRTHNPIYWSWAQLARRQQEGN